MIDILQSKDPRLRQKSEAVMDFAEIQDLVDQLLVILRDIRTERNIIKPAGLSAVQIGVLKRVFVITADKTYVVINPQIVKHSEDKIPIREGCFSLAHYRAMVPRYAEIRIKALDRNGKEFEISAKDHFASILQHEIDHLNGVLMTDRLPNKEKDLFYK